MRLIILGSGTCVPSLKRNASGYLLETEGYQVLIDCGSGTLLQLEKACRSYKTIDAVFISHKHPDHFADLMPLIHALLYTPSYIRDKDLFIFAPKGFRDYYCKAIESVLGEPQDFQIRLNEIKNRADFGPFDIFSSKTVHSVDSVAFRFEHNGKAVVFTGDADYDQEIISLAEGSDILVADCSFPESMKVRGHLSAKECGIVAQKAGVKKLVLSHLYPADTPDIDRVTEVKENYEGEVVIAEDLMEIDV